MINTVELIGNTGRDLEIFTTHSGQKIGSLSVATTKSWKDKNSGEKREKVSWHKVKIFKEPTVNFLWEYAKAGSLVRVIGEISYGSYEKDGTKHHTTEIHVGGYEHSVTLLRRPNTTTTTPHDPETGEVTITPPAPNYDDEIPF